jgi:tight adherence protein C
MSDRTNNHARRWFRVRRTMGIAVLAWVLGPTLSVVVLLTGITLRKWHMLRRSRLAVDGAQRQLPDAIDMLVLGIRAGLTPAQAFVELGRLLPLPIGSHVAEVVRRYSTGERFADALTALHSAPQSMLRPLATALARAERYGEPLAPVLDRLSDEARRERRRQAESSARQLPVRMCFPLACCTLPAFVILTIVPLLAGTLSSIRGTAP